MSGRESLIYSILAVDAERYSTGIGLDHLYLREHLGTAMDLAGEKAAVQRDRWVCQDTGDGEISLIPPDIPPALLVADFVRELGIALHTLVRPQPTIRLRIALHVGMSRIHEKGFPGPGVPAVVRLLDAPPVKDALARQSAAWSVLVLSEIMYEATVLQEERRLQPRHYRRIDVDANGYRRPAWLTLPDLPPATDDEAHSPADRAGGPGDQQGAARTAPPTPTARDTYNASNIRTTAMGPGAMAGETFHLPEKWRQTGD